MLNRLEKFLGLWLDKNGNILLIHSLKANTLLVSFASGKTQAPIERSGVPQQLTVDVDAEYDTEKEELIVQFGTRYYGPQLQLRYEATDLYREKPSLKPSISLAPSSPKNKKEWVKWFEPLENYVLIDRKEDIEVVLASYKLYQS